MNKERRPMNHRLLAILASTAALFAAAIGAAPAQAEFGFTEIQSLFNADNATPQKPLDDPMQTQAGSHPYAATTYFEVNYSVQQGGQPFLPDEQAKDVIFELPPGFSGNANAAPRCQTSEFLEGKSDLIPRCPIESVVGVASVAIQEPFLHINEPVFNLEPPRGSVARIGLKVLGVPQIVDVDLKQGGEYNVVATARKISQIIPVFSAAVQLWGVPGASAHDFVRGNSCLLANGIFGINASLFEVNFAPEGASKKCPAGIEPKPFLNLPASCTGPLKTHWQAVSWAQQDKVLEGDLFSTDNGEPQGLTGCGKVPFDPAVKAEPSSKSAESPTGLDFDLDFAQPGLTSVDGIAESTAKKIVATLPQGVTINPSIGEGLGYCSPEDYERESLAIDQGEGCPDESKIGTAEVQTPLLDVESIQGSLYLAQQGDETTPELENPFDSLIAVYIVFREPKRGILVKIPLKVEPDPTTGQLVTTADDLPQLPFSHFNLHFREGKRSPLATPPVCGTYDTEIELTPWSDPNHPVDAVSSFEIVSGIDGGACPPGGIPPFKPDFEAGSLDNNAASYSPFDMRLIRHDGEQDMTRFGSILPRGVVGKLAGVEQCSEAAIATARTKTGRQELASPSCPANSQIGTTEAGAGVGPALTYVPGKVYLAGPHKGAPLSVVAITPAVAGPFDAGAVVVRIALDLDPTTAEVHVVGESSDPIPHILKGIPLKVRDLRVHVDREQFILNPTSCNESSARATLFGAYLDLFDPADDLPVDLSTRYQAANCLNLSFAPRLAMRLKGKNTKRGGHPGLRAVYTPSAGQANIEDLVVRLPRSAFLDQSHIRTICTRVQFAADECPKAAQYGYIRAWTPLLDEPLEGPVWLRSSNHKLPDLVFDLRGLVDIEVSTRLDSIRGGIRAKVEDAPDAPISRVVLDMQGAKKGLIINSRNLCRSLARAGAQFDGHNGKRIARRPVMRAECGSGAERSSHRRARVARRSAVG
jgi:hypothetical protein